MKRSATVTLALVPALAAATCGTNAPDPCEPVTYNAQACQYAVDHQGYYHGGQWYSHGYSHPFFYYGQGYSSFLSRGGRALSPPASAWSVPAVTGTRGGAGGGTNPTTTPTSRGGFGATGSGHASAAS